MCAGLFDSNLFCPDRFSWFPGKYRQSPFISLLPFPSKYFPVHHLPFLPLDAIYRECIVNQKKYCLWRSALIGCHGTLEEWSDHSQARTYTRRKDVRNSSGLQPCPKQYPNLISQHTRTTKDCGLIVPPLEWMSQLFVGLYNTYRPACDTSDSHNGVDEDSRMLEYDAVLIGKRWFSSRHGIFSQKTGIFNTCTY